MNVKILVLNKSSLTFVMSGNVEVASFVFAAGKCGYYLHMCTGEFLGTQIGSKVMLDP